MKIVDFAWSRPGVAALLAAGVAGVVRYHSYNTSGKNLTKAEADSYRAAGLLVVSNWEAAGSWAEYSGGAATGRQHATDFAKQQAACGSPGPQPGIFSADFNPVNLAHAVAARHRCALLWPASDNAWYAHRLGRMHPDMPEWGDLTPHERRAAEDHIAANTEPLSGQLSTIADYYRGVNGVIGLPRGGAYGGKKTISYLFDAQVITYGWQTYAWSAGQWDTRAQLRQTQNGITINGADCDLDQSMAVDFGQWMTRGGEQDLDDNQARALGNIEAISVALLRMQASKYVTSVGAAPIVLDNALGKAIEAAGVTLSADQLAQLAALVAPKVAALMPVPPTADEIAERIAARLGNG